MDLKVGRLIFRLKVENRSWRDFLFGKYEKFLTKPRSYSDFTICLIPWQSNDFRISFSSQPGIATLYTPLSLRRFRTFNFFFKTTVATFFLERGGLILHASSLIKNRKGLVFAAKQGVGKSTIIKLASQYQPLSDDFAILRRISGRFLVFSSPFYETNPIPKLEFEAEVGGIYFLVQSQENKIVRVNPRESIPKIVSLILSPLSLSHLSLGQNKKILEKMWQVANDLIEKTPCFMLYFKRDCSFLKLLP